MGDFAPGSVSQGDRRVPNAARQSSCASASHVGRPRGCGDARSELRNAALPGSFHPKSLLGFLQYSDSVRRTNSRCSAAGASRVAKAEITLG